MRRTVIIPCGGAKLPHAAAAAELYTGSMFQDALRTARTIVEDSDIFILSARYGLVTLDEILEPYDQKMTEKNCISDFEVECQALWYGIDESIIEAFLPKAYFRKLQASIAFPVAMHNNYAGCRGIGDQKAVLAKYRRMVAA
jgi:hypothetical protein